MSNTEFLEDNEFHIKSRKLFGEPQTPAMIRVLLKTGIVKTEKQALYFLIGLMIVAVAATWWIWRGGNSGSNYVEAPDGTRYSAEEYFELVDRGEDPLAPDKIRQFNN